MGGFEIFLCVLAGIILLFVLILSIPVHITFTYTDKVYLTLRYLFLKINILPLGEKKKKPKKQKPQKKKEEKPEQEEPEEKKEEKPKEKKPNPILEMVKANGYDGMMLVLGNLGKVLGKYGGNLIKSFVFDEIEVYITIGTGDAASTAIKYGKACQAVYPVVGYLCNNSIVHKYDLNVEPDFLANKSEGEMYFDFHLVVRRIINSTIGMVVRLVFKVALKFLMGAKKNKSAQAASAINEKLEAEAKSVN